MEQNILNTIINRNTIKTISKTELANITANNNSLEIIEPCCIEESGSYQLNKLTFRDNGVLIFNRDFHLEAEEVCNDKSKLAQFECEFLIAGKDGADAKEGEDADDAQDAGTVELLLNNVKNKIRINTVSGNGGKGYDSVRGQDGGNGGDGYQGGDGGSGGDATKATNGGDGGLAPTVTVVYGHIDKKAAIYVNGDKIVNKGEYIKELPGGKGGDAGQAAEGGKGGNGGKGQNSSLDGQPGKAGAKADSGSVGKDGDKGKVSVTRMSLEKRIADLNGLYIFDLSDDEERAYCIRQLGGMEELNKRPLLLEAIEKKSLSNATDEKKPLSIQFVENHFTKVHTGEDSGIDYYCMDKTFNFNLYDNITPISSNSPALKWESIAVTGSIDNVNGEIPLNLGGISYEDINSNGKTEIFSSNPYPESDFAGTLATSMKIKGYTANGEFFYAEYAQKEKIGSAKKYTVTDITVSDPHWNNKHDSYIVMLYARTNESPSYSDPDYVGNDYLNNYLKTAKIATLMPVSGTVTFADGYELVGLTPPDPIFKFTRPYINYDNKAADSAATSPDITYQNDLDNDSLYSLINNETNFKKISGITHPKVEFNFLLDRKDKTSKLDWHDDIAGAADNKFRNVLLRAGFKYRLHKKGDPADVYDDVPINIVGITKENLKNIKREYYKFENGSNTIYIPPIYIYWGCFGKDVRIKTASGIEKTAAAIKIGDQLLAYGGATVTVADIITGRDASICRLKISGGYETLLSGAHRLLDENGQSVTVRELKKGDKVLTESGQAAAVESVEEEEYNDAVYNFSFENQTESVYIIADGLCAGDFTAQNEAAASPAQTAEEAELARKRMEELRSLG